MKREVMTREVMIGQVSRARIRARKMADELDVFARQLEGTPDFVPAIEKVMDVRRAERWLSGYLDELRAIH
jgi:hypothetical protein